MLERVACVDQPGRQIGMVVNADVVAGEQLRQLGCSNGLRLTSIGGSPARNTRSQADANWSLQSIKRVFITP